jgi:hypothetical protein
VLFIAIAPSWFWILLLLMACTHLVRLARQPLGVDPPILRILALAIGLQAMLASANAVATTQYAIGEFACLVGIYGMFATPVVGLAELGLLAYASPKWLQTEAARLSPVGRWALSLVTFNVIVGLAHLRSALLCTV